MLCMSLTNSHVCLPSSHYKAARFTVDDNYAHRYVCSVTAHFSVLLVSLMTCMAALTSGLTMSAWKSSSALGSEARHHSVKRCEQARARATPMAERQLWAVFLQPASVTLTSFSHPSHPPPLSSPPHSPTLHTPHSTPECRHRLDTGEQALCLSQLLHLGLCIGG